MIRCHFFWSRSKVIWGHHGSKNKISQEFPNTTYEHKFVFNIFRLHCIWGGGFLRAKNDTARPATNHTYGQQLKNQNPETSSNETKPTTKRKHQTLTAATQPPKNQNTKPNNHHKTTKYQEDPQTPPRTPRPNPSTSEGHQTKPPPPNNPKNENKNQKHQTKQPSQTPRGVRGGGHSPRGDRGVVNLQTWTLL